MASAGHHSLDGFRHYYVPASRMASAGHHSLDGHGHYGAPGGGAANSNDSTPLLAVLLQLMITILQIEFFCHNTYLHYHRLLLPPEEPAAVPSLVASYSCCNNIHDDPSCTCTCSDERQCLLLDNYCLLLGDYYPMLLHMFAFKYQRDLKNM